MSSVVFGESWGVAAVCVILGGCGPPTLIILLSFCILHLGSSIGCFHDLLSLLSFVQLSLYFRKSSTLCHEFFPRSCNDAQPFGISYKFYFDFASFSLLPQRFFSPFFFSFKYTWIRYHTCCVNVSLSVNEWDRETLEDPSSLPIEATLAASFSISLASLSRLSFL